MQVAHKIQRVETHLVAYSGISEHHLLIYSHVMPSEGRSNALGMQCIINQHCINLQMDKYQFREGES